MMPLFDRRPPAQDCRRGDWRMTELNPVGVPSEPGICAEWAVSSGAANDDNAVKIPVLQNKP